MSKAGKQRAAKPHFKKAQQWASQVISISENASRGGLEIRFNSEPSPELQSKLRAMDFRNSRIKTMWYGDQTGQAREFAEKIKAILPEDQSGPNLHLTPSFDALEINLNKKAFSFVMFTLKNGQTESYVMFEPSKPKAEVIAANFAEEKFGNDLKAFAVMPKTQIRKARTLFNGGMIIYPDENKAEPALTNNSEKTMTTKDSQKQPPETKAAVQSILLTTEAVSREPNFSNGVSVENWAEANAYVKSKIGIHISDVYYQITWQNGEEFSGMVDLEPSEFYDHIEDPLSNHVKTYLTNYSNVEKHDPFYDQTYVDEVNRILSNCSFTDINKLDPGVSTEVKQAFQGTAAMLRGGIERQYLNKFYSWAIGQQHIKSSEIDLETMCKWLRENAPELDAGNISNIWKDHQRTLKSLEVKMRKKSLRHPFDSIYKKILKVIPGLLDHIKAGRISGKSKVDPEGGLMALNFDFLYYDKNGNPIIALSHYFTQGGDRIADPDMQIRLIPHMEIAEALAYQDQFGYKEVYFEKDGETYAYKSERNGQNRFLNQWLTNIIHQGHTIDLSVEGTEDQPLVKPRADQAKISSDQGAELWNLIHKALPTLKLEGEQKNKITVSDEKRHFVHIEVAQRGYIGNFNLELKEAVGGIDVFRASVLLKPEEKRAEVYSVFMGGDQTRYRFPDGWKGYQNDDPIELNAGLMAWLRYLTEKIPANPLEAPLDKQKAIVSLIQSKVYPAVSGTPVFDPQTMARLITDENYFSNAWALSYPKDTIQRETFSKEYQTHLRAFFSIYVMEDRPMQEKYLAVYREIHTETVDLTFDETGTPLPNVIVPKGMKEPFISHNWRAFDMRSLLQYSYLSLTAITNLDLNRANPIQLYELAQLGNPSSYRIAVSQERLIEVWRKRGKELFDILGLPTNPLYPYADLIAGYENMMSLRDLLNDNNTTGDEWWIAAALYRPIADLAKAKAILDEMLEHKKQEKQSYLTADGQRPRPNYKSQVEQMERSIGYIQESLAVLDAYRSQADVIHKSKDTEIQSPHQEETKFSEGDDDATVVPHDPLTNDSGVYTKETAAENFEEITIPMPKSAQYTAEISIVKTSRGRFKKGITAMKNFGDGEGMGSSPSVHGQDFMSRNAALTAALVLHKENLERLIKTKDYILENEEKKKERLTIALKALIKYAEENRIELINDPNNSKDLNPEEDQSGDPEETLKRPYDPLANEDGVYTSDSAGANFETLEIPMPKTASYQGEVFIVKTSEGKYREGIVKGKHFGDVSYEAFFPTTSDETYPTRKAALKAALLHHEQELEILLHREDTILNNETAKRKRLNIAMKALYKFAEEHHISMKAEPDKDEGIIPGLESAYWEKNDSKYEQNKVFVNGQAYHQARLRDLITGKLNAFPITVLEEIRLELASRFRERRPFSSYEQGLVTRNKKGDARTVALIAAYIDDFIIDHDLKDNENAPVMSLLLDIMFSGTTRLVDTLQKKESPIKISHHGKKQSQHELNQEIEAFIDTKDKTEGFYDEQEKNYLRQYTGSGGLLSKGAVGSGTLYEFYTPDGIVKKMWDIAYHYGYDGGSVLEPSVGTGNFLKYAPKTATVIGFETNHYACRIAQVLYPNAHIEEKSFETHFFNGNIHLKDKFKNPGYSLAIGNPPYGSFTGKYAGLGEKRFIGVSEYEQYFTLRSLDLLKPGGLLIFLVPSYFMLSKEKYNKTKERISAKAEWVDAYRFPEGVFPNTSIGTDILVLRKK